MLTAPGAATLMVAERSPPDGAVQSSMINCPFTYSRCGPPEFRWKVYCPATSKRTKPLHRADQLSEPRPPPGEPNRVELTVRSIRVNAGDPVSARLPKNCAVRPWLSCAPRMP